MTPKLAQAISRRVAMTGRTTFRTLFWMLPNGGSVPMEYKETTAPLCPVDAPSWLTAGALVCIPSSAESVAAPYVVNEVSPLMCLIGPPDADPFPIETEKLIQYWGPVPEGNAGK